MFEIFRLQVHAILGSKKRWLVALLLTVPAVLTYVTMTFGGLGELRRTIEANDGQFVVGEVDQIRIEGPDGEVHERTRIAFDLPWQTVGAIYLFLLYPQMLCMLLALLYGSSLLGSELDGKTITYLFTRPIPRWHFVVGKFLAIVAVLLPPTAVSLAVSWQLLGGPGGVQLLGAQLASVFGSLLAYNAVFVLIGFIVPRRAMVVALIYGVVFEFLLSFVPAIVNTFAVTYYLRSIVVEMLQLEVPHEIARIVGDASLPAAIGSVLAITVVGLGGASMLAARREYVVADEAT
ncbi:MAG: ABC transporter permease subunit [Planctomycetota bacterium]